MHLFIYLALILGMTQLSRRTQKSSWKSTQRTVQKLMRLVIETGILTGIFLPLFSLLGVASLMISSICTATVAMVNLILALLPGRPAYFQTTSTVLGKMYSNTMMVVLNSRMTYARTDTSSLSNEFSESIVFTPRSHVLTDGTISVTREQWTDPLEDYKTDVSIANPSFDHTDTDASPNRRSGG